MHTSFRQICTLAFSMAALVLILALPATAQNRIIKGTITNEKGEPLQNVNISIQGTDVKREYTTKTDKKGQFLYMGIPAGEYRVVARLQGYFPEFIGNLKPSIQSESQANLQLKPGDMNQKLPFEMSAQELEKAKADQAKAEQRKKSSAEVKAAFDAGLALANAGKYEEAIAEYNKALEKDPEQAYVMANMADAYSKMNKLNESLASYQKAIALKPDDPAMYTNMGVVLGKMGKTAESQEAFKKAAAMNPAGAAQNFYNLGATQVNSGNVKEAAEAFKQAIAADPNFAEAYYQLGMCLSGDPATMPDAVKALQQYIKMPGAKPDQIEVAKQLIEVLSKK